MPDESTPQDDDGSMDDIHLHEPAGGAAGATATEPPTVLIAANVQETMWHHALSDTSHEIGGVLVGRVIAAEDRPVVQVEAALPAQEAEASLVSITFTHESWEHWHRLLDEEYVGRVIVGWYHSHPNFGIFLSGHDMFIQKNFFNQHWQVAVVIDPIRGEVGCFGWAKDTVARMPDDQVSPMLERRSKRAPAASAGAPVEGAGAPPPPQAPAGPAAAPPCEISLEPEPGSTPLGLRAWWLGWGVAIAMVIIVILQTVALARMSRVLSTKGEAATLKASVDRLSSTAEGLKGSVAALQGKAPIYGHWHTWREADSFAALARDYYGNSEYARVLESVNPQPASAGLGTWPAPGDKIWIPAAAALKPPAPPAAARRSPSAPAPAAAAPAAGLAGPAPAVPAGP